MVIKKLIIPLFSTELNNDVNGAKFQKMIKQRGNDVLSEKKIPKVTVRRICDIFISNAIVCPLYG